MKRKHFTKPPHLNAFGKWLFAELFARNITINELAALLDISSTTIRTYMKKPKRLDGPQTHIPAYRVLEICAAISPTIMEYHKMVPDAMRAMPNYYDTFEQQQPQDKPCQQ